MSLSTTKRMGWYKVDGKLIWGEPPNQVPSEREAPGLLARLAAGQ